MALHSGKPVAKAGNPEADCRSATRRGLTDNLTDT
jgi:hypothetical protein